MAIGKISKSVFTDIGNAIRTQNGTAGKLLPREMAAAVAALDGVRAGDAAAYEAEEGVGVISSAVFGAIAGAIRAQNGEETLYTPPEMAPAILALSWGGGLMLRALLLDDGTLEFNYLEGEQSTLGRAWTKVYCPETTGYATSAARPWDADKLEVKRVVFDSSVSGAGVANVDFWFLGCANLLEVSGFEALQGMTSAKQMFNGCGALESIYATSFSNAGLSGALMFANCVHLVGGYDGYVPAVSSGAGVCKLGAGGVLCDPTDDRRAWCRVRLYTDLVLFTDMESAGYTDEDCQVDGRICVNAQYNAVGVLPCYEQRSAVEFVVFDKSMSGFATVNMNYWFYGYTTVYSFLGWDYMSVASMRYTFTSCTALSVLSLSGLDGSGVSDLFYTFSGCTGLSKILVSKGFVSPELTSAGCFHGCTKLVGGNGTAWSSGAISAVYFRVDAAGAPGYLTSG